MTVGESRLHICPKCSGNVEMEITLFIVHSTPGKYSMKNECPACHMRTFLFVVEAAPTAKDGGSVVIPEGSNSRMPDPKLFLTKDKKLRCMLCLTENVTKLFALDNVGLVCQGCYEDSDVRAAAREGTKIQAESGVSIAD